MRLMAVGDIFLNTRDGGQDPFTYVKDAFREADVLFGNLEVPLTDVDSPGIEQAVLIKGSPEAIPHLKDARFSVLNVAHNHIRDFGVKGGIDTIRHLEENNIPYIGAGRSIAECFKEVVVEVDGRTIAFVGFYAYGEGLSSNGFHVAGISPQLVRHRIAELKKTHDHVVVSFHWGRENVFYPAPEQQEFARLCIDDGASVVIGHHPHYLHGVEEYHRGLIFYSLGNFNFWQFGMETGYYNRLTCIADIQLSEEKIDFELLPVMIDENYCPRPITSAQEIQSFNEHMEKISSPLPAGVDTWWWFGEIGKPYLVNNTRSFLVSIRRYGIRHFFRMVRWLTSRFVIKCYVGLIRRYLRLGRQSS